MDDLVVAVFDIETATRGDETEPEWNLDQMEFACGVIEWVHLRRGVGRTVSRITPSRPARLPGLASNVYWSPAQMVTDLLLPWSHVICAYNGAGFDVPLLLARTGADHSCNLLQEKLFDPMAWLAERSGHPHPASLDNLREGIEREPWTYDGKVIDHGDIPLMWCDGFMWPVIDCCRDDVEALRDILHTGVHGRISANKLRETHEGKPCGDVRQWLETREKAKFKYSIDTRDWWPELVDIATRVREKQIQEGQDAQ